jgi:hypothetical protein
MEQRMFLSPPGWKRIVVFIEAPTFGEGMCKASNLVSLTTEFEFRSVHNIRIERLWVDVTVQVGSFWGDIFTQLELRHGLNINNMHHIWLVHYLFLPMINFQLSFFAESWNQHRIHIRNGPNRSPADMFGFDMFVHGLRGNQLPAEQDLDDDELEVYGVDWEGLLDDQLMNSQRGNNSIAEEWSSWIGQVGPPDNLNEVPVDSPPRPLTDQQMESLDLALPPWPERPTDTDITLRWTIALGYARAIDNNFM